MHERITWLRDDDEQLRASGFWYELATLREQICQERSTDSGNPERNEDEVTRCLQLWITDSQENGTTWEQKSLKAGQKRSIAVAAFNKYAGWSYAGKAVLQLNLPRLDQSHPLNTATERVHAMACFAEELVHWMQCFAEAIRTHRSTQEYEEAKRRGGASKGISGLDAADVKERKRRADLRWHLMYGKKLSSGCKRRRNMNMWERQVLENYESGNLRMQYAAAQAALQQPQPFRYTGAR